jgi:transaldolase
VELVRAIAGVYATHRIDTQILAASLRDVHHVSRCFLYGANVVTMPPTVFWKMYDHVLTREGLTQFEKDWAEVQRFINTDDDE